MLFIAQALDIQLSLGQQLMMLFIILFASTGGRSRRRGVCRAGGDFTYTRKLAGGGPDVWGSSASRPKSAPSPTCSATSLPPSSCRAGWARSRRRSICTAFSTRVWSDQAWNEPAALVLLNWQVFETTYRKT
jgi:hypothetical protein